ncbi:MAG: hypothetical protein V3R65_04595 [Acidiferrobacterales bacterium]
MPSQIIAIIDSAAGTQPIILTLIFSFGFIVVAYDQIASSRGWTIEPWLMGNSSMKLSGVFSIFMAPALAFHMLSWWISIFVIVAGFGFFLLLIMVLKKHVQFAATAGLVISWVWFATLLVNM